jgi:hypothetical protein
MSEPAIDPVAKPSTDEDELDGCDDDSATNADPREFW